jgi:SAM-dependent methyltransferase
MKKSVDFDQFTDNYNQLLNESTNFFSPSEEYFAQYKVDIVKKIHTFETKSILEYGCGIGRNISFLANAFPGSTIHGSDISEASLDVARKINPEVYFFNENDESIKDNKYDLIFVAGVFHHIPPEIRDFAVSGLYRRLKENGNIFIFEHNPFNPVTRRIVDKCPYDEDAILLKPSELKTRLQKGGLQVVDQSYCLFIPPKLDFLLPIENYLQWLPLGGQYWTHARRPD